VFTANTRRIPPIGTEVFVVMSPRPESRSPESKRSEPLETKKREPPGSKTGQTPDAGSTARPEK
jgi:hypothetical protein